MAPTAVQLLILTTHSHIGLTTVLLKPLFSLLPLNFLIPLHQRKKTAGKTAADFYKSDAPPVAKHTLWKK